MANILSIDTSGFYCSVGLWRSKQRQTLAFQDPCRHGQAERLLPQIQRTLHEAKLTYGDLDRIAVACGPGSFTGLRVGLATARGLGLSGKLPVLGVSSLQAYAWAETGGQASMILVAIDTRRDDFYTQIFDTSGMAQEQPCLRGYDEISAVLKGKAILVGDGAAKIKQKLTQIGQLQLGKGGDHIDVGILARLAQDLEPGNYPALPLYLRPPEAKLPQHGK